jgi:hypothetical protein
VSWRWVGSRWERFDGRRWVAGTPDGWLWLQPFALDYPVPPDADFPEEDPVALAKTAVPST